MSAPSLYLLGRRLDFPVGNPDSDSCAGQPFFQINYLNRCA